MNSKKAQGVVEYVLLLAIVLTISSITALLTGLFASPADNAIAESDLYWSGISRPFSISEHAISTVDGKFYLLITNNEGSGLQITNISMLSQKMHFNFTPQNGYIYSGKEQLYDVGLPGGICGSSGTYQLLVNITYSTQNIANKMQFGEVALVGSCALFASAGQSTNLGGVGTSCTNPNDCNSHRCFKGICVECLGNGHCAIGQQCDSNSCVPCQNQHCGSS